MSLLQCFDKPAGVVRGAFLVLLAGMPSVQAHTFTDTTGRSVEAELVKVTGDTVTIRTATGEFVLPLARFSAADQKFILDSAKAPAAPAGGVNQAVAPAADVKPGATLALDFPDLGPDRHGQPAQCKVSIPQGYDPAKKVSLVIWLGGGDGGNSPDRSFLPEGVFVAAGLPYPKGASSADDPGLVGQFDKIWAYHKRMLMEIYKRVPNIDSSVSIIGGFSNGAHTIDAVLRLPKKGGLGEYFSAFVIADGGGSNIGGNGSYPSMKGKFAYVCWGEKSPNRPNGPVPAKQFKLHGAKVVASEMKDTPHAFPASEKEKVKAWLATTVMPALLKGEGASGGVK